MIRLEYKTEEEREQIYNEYIEKGLFLIEEQFLFEGNFLIFGTEEELEEAQPKIKKDENEEIIKNLQQKLTSQEQAIAELTLLLSMMMGGAE